MLAGFLVQMIKWPAALQADLRTAERAVAEQRATADKALHDQKAALASAQEAQQRLAEVLQQAVSLEAELDKEGASIMKLKETVAKTSERELLLSVEHSALQVRHW
jgi:predicted  nucleic acid-binding Zn-ribbon protein